MKNLYVYIFFFLSLMSLVREKIIKIKETISLYVYINLSATIMFLPCPDNKADRTKKSCTHFLSAALIYYTLPLFFYIFMWHYRRRAKGHVSRFTRNDQRNIYPKEKKINK